MATTRSSLHDRTKPAYVRKAVGMIGLLALVAGCGGGGGQSDSDETNKNKVTSIPMGSQGKGASGKIPEPSCAKPQKVKSILTCADVAKAKAEGTVTLYSPDPEPKTRQLMADFRKDFPGIEVKVVYLQTGALYSRLISEREADVYKADVLINSDMAMVEDFEQKKGWKRYVSPELRAYPDEQFRSDPPGLWQTEGTMFGGIAYNPDKVKGKDIPKTWKDLTKKKWQGEISFKTSISGLQHLQWYTLRNLYGDDYWDKISDLKPRAFDSYVQQYDRLISGEDTIVGNAQYSGYLEYKQRGANLKFVAPPTGMHTGPQAIGIPTKSPHPEAAKLLIDWYMSERGQKAVTKHISLSSVRNGVAPPGNPKDTEGSKFLIPKSQKDYIESQKDFQRNWNQVTGVAP